MALVLSVPASFAEGELDASETSASEAPKIELIRIEEDIPEPMVLLTESMVGPDGVVEFDPERRIAGVRGEASDVARVVAFLQVLNTTYRESARLELMETEEASNPWVQTAKYFGKLQPGESVQIEALLLMSEEQESRKPIIASKPQKKPSRKQILEDMVLELDEEKREILETQGSGSPRLAEIKSEMGMLLDLIDKEAESSDQEIEQMVARLVEARDEANDRIRRVDPDSAELSVLRQEIIQYNQALEEAKTAPAEETLFKLAHLLGPSTTNEMPRMDLPERTVPALVTSLPLEAQMMGLTAEDLGMFAAGDIETLGHTSLRATVFGSDSNGIAFTTVSDFSLEFRLGHSTLGVTVALIPERKVRDQSKGIQGVVTRLNKILLDTETEVELNRPVVVGGYTHSDGSQLLLAVKVNK